MLARRRLAARQQQQQQQTPGAPAAAVPTVSPGGGGGAVAAGAQAVHGAGGGGGAAEAALQALVAERVAAYGAHALPSLVTEQDGGEAADANEDAAVLVGGGAASAGAGTSRCRARLTHMALLVYLFNGGNPPDYARVEPCARLECWLDPLTAQGGGGGGGGSGGGGGGSSSSAANEAITSCLDAQYRAALRDVANPAAVRVVDRPIGEAEKELARLAAAAGENRMLFHYNGHGMPRATELGEIWMFSPNWSHYMPMNVVTWAAERRGSGPTVFVLDCNCAGAVLNRWLEERMPERRPQDILICACAAGEALPLSPDLPADLLTACLTTPLQAALQSFVSNPDRLLLLPRVTPEMVRQIPGSARDRKSPLGELQWILSAVTETIAWCCFSLDRYHALMHRDPVVRRLICNAILAGRVMRAAGCTPVTSPPLPERTHLHPLWDLWDYELERALSQLPRLAAAAAAAAAPSTAVAHSTPAPAPYVYQNSRFLEGQLTAFEVWLGSGALSGRPQQLPCVLLALKQPAYLIRAFALLTRYLDSGRAAGRRAVVCGILPFMRRFIKNPPETFLLVTVLWMQVIRADPAEGCAELQHSDSVKSFTRLLKLNESEMHIQVVDANCSDFSPPSLARSGSASGSATTPAGPAASSGSNGGEKNGRASSSANGRREEEAAESSDSEDGDDDNDAPTPGGGRPKLSALPTHAVQPGDTTYYLLRDVDLARCKSMTCYILCQFLARGERQCIQCWNDKLLSAAFPCLASPNAELRSWACLLLARLISGLRHAKSFVSRECTARLDHFTHLLKDRSPVVRSSCVSMLATIVGVRMDLLPAAQQPRRAQMEKTLLIRLRALVDDASMNVREELTYFAANVLYAYRAFLDGESVYDFVQRVGASADWRLQEHEVGVRSQLHASRPTTSTRFEMAITFDTTHIPADDAPPATPELAVEHVDPEAAQMILGLLHDAGLMLYRLHSNCDTQSVGKALEVLASGAPPQSARFALQALLTMSSVTSTAASRSKTEAERLQSTWNADVMKQLVLDMHNRRLDPPPPPPPAGAGADDDTASAAPSSSSRYQVLPSVVPADLVVCAAPRLLEASFVVATKAQQLVCVSYENYSALAVTHSFTPKLPAPIQDVCLVNDLAVEPGVLVLTARGGFSLLKGCWDRDTLPTEVAVFSACPPSAATGAWLDIKSVYRNHTATLFYGGRIGASGATEIHALSLTDEQIVQRLEVAGGAALTGLTAHSTQRALFAGFGDSVVRYYDDRQNQGQLGSVSVMQCGPRGAPIVGLDIIASPGGSGMGTTFQVAAATPRALYIFDSRKMSEPAAVFSVEQLYRRGTVAGDPDLASATAPSIAACSAGIHTGLISVAFADSSFGAYNARGALLLDGCLRPRKLPRKTTTTAAAAAPGGPPPALMPASCRAHPLRPLMTCGGDLVTLQL